MAAGRRVKVIFQLESGFGTHQKITIFNHQMFPSGPTVSTTEVQGWKKVRIRLLTCVFPETAQLLWLKIIQNFSPALCLIRPRTLENVCFLIQKFRFEARSRPSTLLWGVFFMQTWGPGRGPRKKKVRSNHNQVYSAKNISLYNI